MFTVYTHVHDVIIKCVFKQEYDEQGRVETEIALTELRNFCKQNDVWGTIGKLNDSKRSASI